ncbi:hypothetical protein BOX15_Mlig007888g2, partial [Macrostomum lignano]
TMWCRRLATLARGHPYRSACALLALFACTQLMINSSLVCSLLFSQRAEPAIYTPGLPLGGRHIANGTAPTSAAAGSLIDLPLLDGNSSASLAEADLDPADSAASKLPLCPNVPPKLRGLLPKAEILSDPVRSPSWSELAAQFPDVRHGGSRPADCQARQRVAIVVPFRNRDAHLRLFLANLVPMLQRQQLHFKVFAIEQAGTTRFNRAMLFNIGFKEAMRLFKPNCFIFHDVDLLPEHDHNMYRCGAHPRHMSAAVDKFKYRLPYATIFGGACALTPRQFEAINGFSNLFFGWGGEDDDFANRVVWSGFKISRYPLSIARYTMIKHKTEEKNKPNPMRFKLIKFGKKRWHSDGLNSLQYTVSRVQDRQLAYFISVEIPESQILRRAKLL